MSFAIRSGRQATLGAARAVACCLGMALTSRTAWPQATPPYPTQRAGKYAVELRLPANGLTAGEEVNVPFHLSDTSQNDPVQGTSPVVKARIAARVLMPRMPAMPQQAPKVQSKESPGDYSAALTFPHPGDYQIDLTVTPPGDKAFTVSFPVSVHGAKGTQGQQPTMGMEQMHDMHGMMRAVAGVSAMQEASGTSWQPAVTPMVGIHSMSGRWALMTHYNAFVSYDRQDGPRGRYQYNSANWVMLMAQRPVRQDDLQLRVMLSLEPLTVTPGGYPLLFQSGEQYHGHPLVDRQHPHDLFMELAARYIHPTGKDSAVSLYVAPSGEPALGPTAFMHRLSAMDNPMSPITHHWMDSTHIDFGVLTLGVWKRNVQLEGSYFTGREPNEFRYDFTPMHLDSFSGRLTYNPGASWSLQTSYGYLHSPEQLRPDEDVRRTTASVTYNTPRRDGGFWANTLAFGSNSSKGIDSDATLFETELNLGNRNTLFGRFEYVHKLGEELDLTPADQKFGITETTLGYVHDFTPNRPYQTGIGAAVTFNTHPAALDSLYGTSPMGFWVFFRIRPAPMKHHGSGMEGMHMPGMHH